PSPVPLSAEWQLLTDRRLHLPHVPMRGFVYPRLPSVLPLQARLLAYGQYAAVREGLALGLLIALVLFSFRDALLGGLVAFQNDTQVFFYPLASWFAEELKAGRFPLWNPYIFAGYPIF